MDIYEIRQLMSSGVSIFDLELRVASYSRVSTDSAEQLKSLQHQDEYFVDLIGNKNKWVFIGSYSDEGISGLSTNKREQFSQMIEDAKEGKFDLILTKEISRFSRNLLDSIGITRELLRYNVGVFFTSDNLNTIDPDSELRLSIMATLAQEESRKISTRVRFGYKRSIKNGVVLGNDKIYGYKKDNGKLVIVEKEAEMVRKIYELYSQGNGVRRIGNKISELGYTTSNGSPIGYTTIRRILENEKYKGVYVGGKTSKIDIFTNKRKNIDKEEWTVWKDEIGDTVPQIVSEELWDKCNALLQKKRNNALNNVSSNENFQTQYKYSGVLLCKNCNNTFWRAAYKYKSGVEKELWRCKTAALKGKKSCNSPVVYTKDLDEVLKDFIMSFINDKSFIAKILDILKTISEDTDYSKNIKSIQSKIAAISKKKDKLLELVMEELITNKEFQVRNDELSTEIYELNNELDKLNKLNLSKEEKINSLTDMIDCMKKRFSDESDLDYLIPVFIKSIYVSEDTEYNEIGNKIDLEIKLKSDHTFTKSYIKYNRQTKGNKGERSDYIEVCSQSSILTGTNYYVIK